MLGGSCLGDSPPMSGSGTCSSGLGFLVGNGGGTFTSTGLVSCEGTGGGGVALVVVSVAGTKFRPESNSAVIGSFFGGVF